MRQWVDIAVVTIGLLAGVPTWFMLIISTIIIISWWQEYRNRHEHE